MRCILLFREEFLECLLLDNDRADGSKLLAALLLLL